MMRYVRMCAAVVLLMLAVQCALWAQGVVVSHKYEQLPNMGESTDLASEDKASGAMWMLTAEDWICPDGRDITDIHWWGAYWAKSGAYKPYSDGLPGIAPSGLQGFTINIYDNTSSPWDQPGTVRWSNYFPISSITQSEAGTVTKPLTGMTEKVYKYDLYLPTNLWIQQTKDQRYWISIQANTNDDNLQWGWHESTGAYGRNSQQLLAEDDLWYQGCGGHDMAFVLTTVPEPGSMMALGTGLIGLGGILVRRRRG